MRSEAVSEISSKDNFSLKLSVPLVLRIGFVTVNEPLFLDSLITLGNLEGESDFECSFLAALGTMPGFARHESPRLELLSPFLFFSGPCQLE